ncbi:MAG: NAD(P)/FAD-dependent oxidoreductase [Anaerolineae bacterium]|nr:NAD(P)/FAD-dependent oxidoreductase [Anaerolineae bacterium]
MHRTEVVIVGGGPAGAACAGRLRQRGVDCLILDRRRFPRAKPCAGWITPLVLRDLDLAPADYPGGLTTFAALVISIRGLTFRLPTRQHAIRRCEFDDWLLRRAQVPVHHHQVRTIDQVGGAYVVDGAFAAKYVVGAGGTRCPVRRALFQGAEPRDAGSLVVTLEEEFPYPHTDPHCRLWFLEHGLPGYAWYVPKANGIVNVGIGGKAEPLRARGDPLKRHWGLLLDKLDRLGLVRGRAFRPRGYAYYLRQDHPEVRRDNALLVGDAVGLATLDMGEGIGPAVRSGLLAAEAILHDSDYDAASIPRLSLLPSLGRFRAARRPPP